MCSVFFNDPSTTEIYTLSLHDALPISGAAAAGVAGYDPVAGRGGGGRRRPHRLRDHPDGADRKSTRLNSSHVAISYAVFCLKKKYRESKASRLLDTDQNYAIDSINCCL